MTSAEPFPHLARAVKLRANSFALQKIVRGLVKLERDGSNPRSGPEGVLEQAPNRFGHRTRMRVCVKVQQIVPARNMQLNNSGEIQIAKKRLCGETVINGVNIDVVQIQENSTTGLVREAVQELSLIHLMVKHIDVVDVIL